MVWCLYIVYNDDKIDSMPCHRDSGQGIYYGGVPSELHRQQLTICLFLLINKLKMMYEWYCDSILTVTLDY